jgi:uncharacterized protein YdaU (DUF1376 family)
MAFYVSDYIADTMHLSATQHGAYLLLISHYWIHGGLPTDEAMLQRIARMSAAEWAENRPTLAKFFKEGWRHSRIEREMEDARAKYEKRANAGRCGGKASGRSRRSNASTMLPQQRSNAEPTTTTYNSVANATGVTAPAEPPAVTAIPDWRERLFRQGLASLRQLTGKPDGAARSLLGRWLRDARDDARKVLRAIEDAQEQQVAEPVAWIEAALKGQPAQRADSMSFLTARA